MYLSMFFETTFSIFEKIRDKYSLTIGNPLLYLHMCGTPQPARMANMNVRQLIPMHVWLWQISDFIAAQRLNFVSTGPSYLWESIPTNFEIGA